MKCTNKSRKKLISLILLTSMIMLMISGCQGKTDGSESLKSYMEKQCQQSSYKGDFFASDLCVTDQDISLSGYTENTSLHAAGLFDLQSSQVLYSQSMFTKLYPASVTKIMTAYLAIKYGNVDDMVTVSERALDLEAAATTCGLRAGDQVSLRDLLSGLLLVSGNDAAVAIAEHISGSLEDFVELMNQEAKALGAVDTNFCNPHGLHEENHYSTAYDLYLIFNACLEQPLFKEIISETSYTGCLKHEGESDRTEVWTPTNYYSAGKVSDPEGIHVIGGKTGTTDEAGSCVILYAENTDGRPYIVIVMGAADKSVLYANTTALLQAGNDKDSD